MKKNNYKKGISLRSLNGFMFFLLLIIGVSISNHAEAQVASYTFSSSSGVYTPIIGDTLWSAPWDDQVSGLITIPFYFVYNNQTYNTLGVSANGYITMGTVPYNAWCGLQNNPLRTIAGYSTDLVSSDSTSTIQFTTLGLSPNMQFVIQWTGCEHYGSGGNYYTFQIILNETSNTIQVVWGPTTDATTMGANNCADASTESGSVGLLGDTTSDFNNRVVTNGTNTWGTSIAGDSLKYVCNMSSINVPANGLTYTWTPPAPVAMTYVSSTTDFLNNTQEDVQNTAGVQILKIKVVTTGLLSPMDITSLNLTTNGCTNAGTDIANAKVYFTGPDNVFSNANQFGATVNTPNGTYTVNGSQTLFEGTNYFWVTYDLDFSAGYFDTLSGCCMNITGSGVMGTQVPTVTCPAGYQSIAAPMAYNSCTSVIVDNLNTDPQGSVNNPILQVQIMTNTGILAPFNISSLSFNTNGCTDAAADIASVNVYFTGTSNVFSMANPFGSFSNPNGAYTVTGSATLSAGTNYFWVTYDIKNTAIVSDILSGCFTQVVGSGTMGTHVPVVSCPVGYQTVIPTLGNWTVVTATAPDYNMGGMLLLSNGTVMCKTSGDDTSGYGKRWDLLTPDIHGSYINGSWSQLASMHDSRLYFSSQVLKDGRVYIAGGEYGTGQSKSEVYNPLTDTWTQCPATGYAYGDANSEIRPDGTVLQACEWNNISFIYNPQTNTYGGQAAMTGGVDESAWVKLPDNSVLFVNIGTETSERYIPSTNQWIADGNLPVELYDAYGSETGAGFLLPDGRVFFIGATGFTAYYTPSGNINPGTWVSGPIVPNYQGTPDAAAAMMADGKILYAVSPVPIPGNVFQAPTIFYEFDYLTNRFIQIGAPGGGTSVNEPCYVTSMVDLPDGSVLFAQQQENWSNIYYVYTPAGTPLPEGKPTITHIIQTSCDSFMITGKLFNGISEGAAYGDDWQMASNYPIVRVSEGGDVYYARTSNWNRTSVQTGNAPDTALFVLPSGLPDTSFWLILSANGNPSDSMFFSPFPIVSFAGLPDTICITDGNITLTGSPAGGTFSGSGVTANVFNPSSLTTGNYTIVYSYTDNTTGCQESSSRNIYVSACTGIPVINSLGNALHVYPNPAEGQVTVSFLSKVAGNYLLKVTDVIGQTIIEDAGKTIEGENKYSINLDGKAKGVYLIILQNGDETYNAKLIVE